MEHELFKPKSFDEGKHAVVGDCNGMTMQERWDQETPLFAKEILSHVKKEKSYILDYGCGVGRLAKAIVGVSNSNVIGVDASTQMLSEAKEYVNNKRFDVRSPHELAHFTPKFDVAYCIYVLQHVPAIEIRDILSRIHFHLKENGVFIYCSSDYRMAINFDKPGFFDDRCLGVNLRDEISRLFVQKSELFSDDTIERCPVLQKMIRGDGGLPHPAYVYKKKKIKRYFDTFILDQKGVAFVKKTLEKASEIPQETKTRLNKEYPKEVLLINRLAPGDVLVMSNAIRDLDKAFPGQFKIDVRTPCNEIFDNNPHITKLKYSETEYQVINNYFSKLTQADHAHEKHWRWMRNVFVIDMQYPMIHRSGACGYHFSEGHRDWLESLLHVKIPQSAITPEIYLSQNETDWPSPAKIKMGLDEPYWVINAGSKNDYTLKQYPYYQEVVDLLKIQGDINLVQIGQKAHKHSLLNGAIDMLGKTNLRELFRLIYHAEGVISCVSLPMHVAAAFRKPCVVVAGAREGTRWELYPNHQFLYVNGCLPCATYDGCWRSKLDECNNKVNNAPRCMTLIKPEDVVRCIDRYYEGGILERQEVLA